MKTTDTTGDGINDSYKSTLTLQNNSQQLGGEDLSFYKMNIGADLEGRGCTDLDNTLWNWIYQATGADTSRMITNSVGTTWKESPGTSIDFNYQIKKDLDGDGIEDIIGFEEVPVEMVSQDGSIGFGYQAPIPESATFGLMAGVGASFLAIRRFFRI